MISPSVNLRAGPGGLMVTLPVGLTVVLRISPDSFEYQSRTSDHCAPSKLMDEVQKARAAKNKAESAKALAGAHRLFDQGKYADAKKEAYRAANLHGPYSMWDFGDRPSDLLNDARRAREKEKLVAVRGGPPLDSSRERRPTTDEFSPQCSQVGARYPPCGGVGILAGAAHEREGHSRRLGWFTHNRR